MIKKIFQILGLPKVITWEETGIKPAAKKKIQTSIANAPHSGELIVSGVASPIMIEFYEQKRKLAAVNYVDFFNAKFTDDHYDLPNARDKQVTLIYGVGQEPVKTFEYSSKVLQSLISKYDGGLVIIETSMTPSNFNLQYGLSIKNKFIIPKVEEELWT